MSPSFAAPPRGPTRPLSPLGEYPTRGSLRCPGSPSGGLHPGRGRKELRPPLTLAGLGPSPPGAGGVRVLVPPAQRLPKAEEREPGAELPQRGGAGREGAGGVSPRRGPAGTNSRRGGSLAPVPEASPPLPRRSRKPFAPWSRCLQCVRPLDVKVHAGASGSREKERQRPPIVASRQRQRPGHQGRSAVGAGAGA